MQRSLLLIRCFRKTSKSIHFPSNPLIELRYFSSNDFDRASILTIGKSVSWITAGVATSLVIPSTAPSALSILSLAYFASRAAQPLVNTKLGVQRQSIQQRHSIVHLLKNEILLFQQQFLQIGLGKNSHAGGNVYALRGAFAKMLTFAGFEAIYSLISPSLLSCSIPVMVIIPISGLISGLLQGTVVSLPEYLSTLQSRYPEKSNAELIALIQERLKHTYGLPIITVALRNGVFDMIFNTLRVGFGIPFGPSAVAAMTLNYPIERFRSLVHQNIIPQSDNNNLQQGEQKTGISIPRGLESFQGWFAKAIEFFTIYQLLQLLKELV